MQNDPKKIEQPINHLETRIRQIKFTLEELLISLDLQDNVSYQDTINKYSALASDFSAIQTVLKKSALSVSAEDNSQLLKTNLMVPQQVSLLPDQELQSATDGRIVACNHEIIPVLLRTKLTPDLEEEERKIEQDRATRQSDQVLKQIALLNKHLESMINRLETASRQPADRQRDRSTFISADTTTLVKAICRGIGIQPKPQGLQAISSSQSTAAAGAPIPTAKIK